MSDRSSKSERGFSLLEMLVAMTIGTIAMGAAVQLYSQGVAATWQTSQRAELQQDFRAVSGMLTKDLSLAGAGLTQGMGIELPTSATLPVYGCDQTTACYLGSSNNSSKTYPTQSGGAPYLYGLIPGYQLGPTLTSNPNATDVITVTYTDNLFYLNCYTASFQDATHVVFTMTTNSLTSCGQASAAVQALDDQYIGLTPGDLILFSFGTSSVVGEVTGTPVAGTNGLGQTTYTVPFAAGDVLKMNQAAASSTNSLAKTYSNNNATAGTGLRLLVITYYINNTINPSQLMRQISGHSPMPVVDGIVFMQFTYDLFNDSTNLPAVACSNPGAISDGCSGASTGLLPTSITKINIKHMAMRSTVKGAQGGYQGIDLETSVGARNLTFSNTFQN